jgi:hypothetical protein
VWQYATTIPTATVKGLNSVESFPILSDENAPVHFGPARVQKAMEVALQGSDFECSTVYWVQPNIEGADGCSSSSFLVDEGNMATKAQLAVGIAAAALNAPMYEQ